MKTNTPPTLSPTRGAPLARTDPPETTPTPIHSAELAEVLDEVERSEATVRARRELEAATRPPRGAD